MKATFAKGLYRRKIAKVREAQNWKYVNIKNVWAAQKSKLPIKGLKSVGNTETIKCLLCFIISMSFYAINSEKIFRLMKYRWFFKHNLKWSPHWDKSRSQTVLVFSPNSFGNQINSLLRFGGFVVVICRCSSICISVSSKHMFFWFWNIFPSFHFFHIRAQVSL